MKKLQDFFQKLFFPVYTFRNIALVFGFGLFMIGLGILIDWVLYGTVRPDLQRGSVGDWVTIIGAGAWIVVFAIWSLRGIFGTPEPKPMTNQEVIDQVIKKNYTPRVESLLLDESTYLKKLKNKITEFLDRNATYQKIAFTFILSFIALIFGQVFEAAFLDLTNAGVLIAVYGCSMWLYREFFYEMDL